MLKKKFFLFTISSSIHRAATLSAPGPGFSYQGQRGPSRISLLVSDVCIISRAQAALPLCGRPHAAPHHCLAMFLSPRAGSLTCARHTSVMAYINTTPYWQKHTIFQCKRFGAPQRAIMYKPNHLD